MRDRVQCLCHGMSTDINSLLEVTWWRALSRRWIAWGECTWGSHRGTRGPAPSPGSAPGCESRERSVRSLCVWNILCVVLYLLALLRCTLVYSYVHAVCGSTRMVLLSSRGCKDSHPSYIILLWLSKWNLITLLITISIHFYDFKILILFGKKIWKHTTMEWDNILPFTVKLVLINRLY